MKEETLQKLRIEIDAVNTELVAVLNKRAAIAQRIGVAKQDGRVYLPAREALVLEQVIKANAGPLSDAALGSVFKEVIAACRNLERRLHVAYLGPEGTYSGEAAAAFAGATSSFLPCSTIDDAITAVQKGDADIAVVPVENSTEGAVNRTLDLLLESSLHITGEVVLPIHHQLLGKARSLADITEVIAHPQALAQCRRWLAEHLLHAKQTPASSNAEAARLAAMHPKAAAIAGTLAAEVYKLPVLAANIEDSPTNTTRFLVLGGQEVPPTGNDKTSLVCSVPNRSGSLYELLGIFAKDGINMTKLESRPADSNLWDYVFYIDVDGHQTDSQLAQALSAAREHATLVKVLGSYPKGRA